jgi:hypothetical protein
MNAIISSGTSIGDNINDIIELIKTKNKSKSNFLTLSEVL